MLGMLTSSLVHILSTTLQWSKARYTLALTIMLNEFEYNLSDPKKFLRQRPYRIFSQVCESVSR